MPGAAGVSRSIGLPVAGASCRRTGEPAAIVPRHADAMATPCRGRCFL